MIKNGIELLAPVGKNENLKVAIENGADAIYLGMPRFNARENAQNFGFDELEQAIDYAHSFGVKVYLTANTLIKNDEIYMLLDSLNKVYQMGIDAVIVQDLGVAKLIKKYFSDLDMHASTQMSICDLRGVEWARDFGFKRVVLARELSIKEIKQICDAVKQTIDIEVFVHGALCVSSAGQCLMSSCIGGRSGNRGVCAQPCRMKYDLLRDGEKVDSGYLLSTKDIFGVECISELANAGVKSFKIEGRMRQSEYVAATTSIYRKYIDRYLKNKKATLVEEQDLNILLQVFNRGGANPGWLTNPTMGQIESTEKPKNWGVKLGTIVENEMAQASENLICVKLEEDIENGDGIEIMSKYQRPITQIVSATVSYIKAGKQLVKLARKGETVVLGDVRGKYQIGDVVYKTSSKRLNTKLLSGEVIKKRKISLKLILEINKPAKLIVEDEYGNKIAKQTEELVVNAAKGGVTKERLEQQLAKSGEFPFEVIQTEVETPPSVYLAISQINTVRRAAFESLVETYVHSAKRRPAAATWAQDSAKWSPQAGARSASAPALHTTAQAWRLPGDWEQPPRAQSAYLYLPPTVLHRDVEALDDMVERAVCAGAVGMILNNVGHFKYLKNYPQLDFIAGPGFNVYNNVTLEVLKDNGVNKACISEELMWQGLDVSDLFCEGMQVVKPLSNVPIVMNTAFCPVGKLYKCKLNNLDIKNKERTICPYGKDKWQLIDKKGAKYEVKLHPVGCGCIIFGHKEFNYE